MLRKSEAPWWNHSLTLAKQSVKCADRRARLQPTDMNLKDSQCKRHKLTTMVRNAKTAYRIHQLEATSTRTVWKTIQHHNTHHKPIPPLDGQSDFKGKCDVLRNALFPTVNTVLQPSLLPNLLTSSKDLRQQTRQVTRAETHLAIIHLKYGTSVGPDKITYDTLRRFNEAVPQLLPHLFTTCLAYAVHPPEWKTANCVVIPKPGKKSYSHPKSYRPISLLSCFGKLLESIVAKQLSQMALMCGATHPSQMGAQPENSAIDALLQTITPIADCISKKKTTKRKPPRPAVLTHDIEGAFNQVHPSTLIEVMEQRCMPLYLTKWVAAFNTDRKIAFGFDQQSEEPQPYRCGLPQGSPISPILLSTCYSREHSPWNRGLTSSAIEELQLVTTDSPLSTSPDAYQQRSSS